MTKKICRRIRFFCYCTSTEGTYDRQFGKCARFPIFSLWVKISYFYSKDHQNFFQFLDGGYKATRLMLLLFLT